MFASVGSAVSLESPISQCPHRDIVEPLRQNARSAHESEVALHIVRWEDGSRSARRVL